MFVFTCIRVCMDRGPSFGACACVCVWYAFLFPSISLHVWICRERHMHTYVSTYIHTCIHTYIYMVPPRPPHGSTFFVRLGAPPHENGGSLRGGASRWTITILWLGELHPGPIEFNRGRLSSIGGRI